MTNLTRTPRRHHQRSHKAGTTMRNDQLKNEATYDQDRLDRYLWEEARATGLSRRDVLKRFTAVLAGAAASGILPGRFCQQARAAGTIITPDPNFLTPVG